MAETKAEGQVKRLKGEVVGRATVNRNREEQVTSVSFDFKAAFVGTVKMKARGEVASAYWSVTPGMKLYVTAVETGKGEYEASAIEVVPAAPPADA